MNSLILLALAVGAYYLFTRSSSAATSSSTSTSTTTSGGTPATQQPTFLGPPVMAPELPTPVLPSPISNPILQTPAATLTQNPIIPVATSGTTPTTNVNLIPQPVAVPAAAPPPPSPSPLHPGITLDQVYQYFATNDNSPRTGVGWWGSVIRYLGINYTPYLGAADNQTFTLDQYWGTIAGTLRGMGFSGLSGLGGGIWNV